MYQNIDKNYAKYMQIDVVLGNPKLGCDGFGICKLISKNNIHKGSACKTAALICMEIERTVLIFFKPSLSEFIYQKHFAAAYFSIETSILIPLEITAFFNITNKLIMKGNYLIQPREQHISVEMNLIDFKEMTPTTKHEGLIDINIRRTKELY